MQLGMNIEIWMNGSLMLKDNLTIYWTVYTTVMRKQASRESEFRNYNEINFWRISLDSICFRIFTDSVSENLQYLQ